MLPIMAANDANVSSEGPVGSLINEQEHNNAPNVNVTLKVAGPKTLWAVRGNLPSGKPWVLTVFAEPYRDQDKNLFWRLEPAIHLTGPQYRAFIARLEPYKFSNPTEQLVLDDATLCDIASRCDHVDPAWDVRWELPAPKADSNPLEIHTVDPGYKKPSEADAFLRFLVERTAIASLPQLKIIWRAICQEGLVWMAQNHKPLNLGFVRLVPLPYRRNWKEIVLALHPAAIAPLAIHADRPARLEGILTNMGVTGDLVNSMLTAVNPAHSSIQWSIEAIPAKAWLVANESVEINKRAAFAPVNYTESVRAAIVKRQREAIAALVSWVRDVQKACGALDDGRTFGYPVLRPWIPKGQVTARAPKRPPTTVVAPVEGKQLIGPVNQEPAGIEMEVMPEVSHLPPPATDLRLEPGPNVAESNGGTPDGVRVLDSGEGKEPE